MKAYKFLIQPSKEQKVLIEKTFGCVRFIYNKMLSDKKDHYQETQKPLYIPPAFYKNKFPWLKEVDSLALCNAQLNLNTAYTNFFRNPKEVGFPAFKSKHKSRKSYTTNLTNNNIKITKTSIKLPKLGSVKLKQHRDFPPDIVIKHVTISCSAKGSYYVSVCFKQTIAIPSVTPETALGLDFSMSSLFIDSDNQSADYPKFYRKSQEQLAKAQRRLSKRVKGSNRYRKQQHKVALISERTANRRKDFLHKLSNSIAKSYDLVCIEDLNMKVMSKSYHFGKSVADNGWGMFTTFLKYKLVDRGKTLVKISKWYPSSKTCSKCGTFKDELKLSERVFICICGSVVDRDYNAAVNILKEGIEIYKAAGHAVSAQLCCGHESARLRSPHLKALA